jgi:hypothetical protein
MMAATTPVVSAPGPTPSREVPAATAAAVAVASVTEGKAARRESDQQDHPSPVFVAAGGVHHRLWGFREIPLIVDRDASLFAHAEGTPE